MADARTFTLRLVGDTKGMQRALKQATRQVDTFGEKVGRAVRAAGRAAAVGVAGVAAAGVALAADMIRAGDQFDKMAKRTGVSVEQLQRMKFAAEQSGSGIDTVEKGLKRMSKFLADADRGLSTYTRQLDELGLSAADFAGLSPDEAFRRFADAVSQVEDPVRRAALAQEVFGRAGTELLPLLAEGSAGIDRLGDQMAATGNIISTEAAAQAAKFNDTLNELRQIGIGGARDALAGLLPTLVTMAEWVRDDLIPALKGLGRWLGDNTDLLKALGAGIAVLALGAVAAKVAKVAQAVRAWTVAQGGLNLALAANPVGIVVVALAALTAGLVLAYQRSETFRRVVDGAFSAVVGAVQIAVGSILGHLAVWVGGVSRVADAVGWLAGKVGIDMDGVTGAISDAADFLSSTAASLIEDGARRIAGAFDAPADAAERTSDRISRGLGRAADAADDAADRISASWAEIEAGWEAHHHRLGAVRIRAAQDQAAALDALNQHAWRMEHDWDYRLAKARERGGLHQAIVEAQYGEHRRVVDAANDAISASTEAAAAKVLSSADRLAAGMAVTMRNACGTVTGFRQCVDGVVVEFGADMQRIVSDAERLAAGVAVPIINACGTVTGFRQCVDGVVVEFDADMQRIVSSADRMASGVSRATRAAATAAQTLTSALGPVRHVAGSRTGDLSAGDRLRRDAGVLAAARDAAARYEARIADLRRNAARLAPGARRDAVDHQIGVLERRRDSAQTQIDRFDGPRLGSGGIVRRPTVALVGESGPEAVVPLGQVGATINVSLEVHGSVLAERDVADAAVEAVAEAVRRGELTLTP